MTHQATTSPSGSPSPQEQAILSQGAQLGINLRGNLQENAQPLLPRLEIGDNIVIRIPVAELLNEGHLPASYKTALTELAQRNGFGLSIVTLGGNEHIHLAVSGVNVEAANTALGLLTNVIRASPSDIAVIDECLKPGERDLYLPDIVAVDPDLARYRTLIPPSTTHGSTEATSLAYQMTGVIGISFTTQLTPESAATSKLVDTFRGSGFKLVVTTNQALIEGATTSEDVLTRIETLVNLLKEHVNELQPVQAKLQAEHHLRTPDAAELTAYRANPLEVNLDSYYPGLQNIAREGNGACCAYDNGHKFGALFPLPAAMSDEKLKQLSKQLPKPDNVSYNFSSSDRANLLEVEFRHAPHAYKPQDIASFGRLLLQIDAIIGQSLIQL
jgi:hypothetical protein